MATAVSRLSRAPTWFQLSYGFIAGGAVATPIRKVPFVAGAGWRGR